MLEGCEPWCPRCGSGSMYKGMCSDLSASLYRCLCCNYECDHNEVIWLKDVRRN